MGYTTEDLGDHLSEIIQTAGMRLPDDEKTRRIAHEMEAMEPAMQELFPIRPEDPGIARIREKFEKIHEGERQELELAKQGESLARMHVYVSSVARLLEGYVPATVRGIRMKGGVFIVDVYKNGTDAAEIKRLLQDAGKTCVTKMDRSTMQFYITGIDRDRLRDSPARKPVTEAEELIDTAAENAAYMLHAVQDHASGCSDASVVHTVQGYYHDIAESLGIRNAYTGEYRNAYIRPDLSDEIHGVADTINPREAESTYLYTVQAVNAFFAKNHRMISIMKGCSRYGFTGTILAYSPEDAELTAPYAPADGITPAFQYAVPSRGGRGVIPVTELEPLLLELGRYASDISGTFEDHGGTFALGQLECTLTMADLRRMVKLDPDP